jgi:predicted MFS family arabinose efflux permease
MGPAHPESWWILLVTSVFTGIAAAFSMPARQSIIPELVGRGELMNAVSLNTMGLNIFRLVSPAVAGFLIDAVNFAAVYYVICALFLMGVIFTALLPRTSAARRRGSSPLNDITEGLRYIRSRPSIFFLLSFGFTFVVMFIPFQNLLPVFSDSILNVGATGLGILMSVSGAGALAASIVLASFPPRQRGLLHLSFTLILSSALIIFSFTHLWWLSLVLMVFIGMGQTVHVTTGTTLIQSLAEPQYMGRVMSILIMNFGLSGLGTFLAGILAQGTGIQWAIGGFGMALAAISLAALLFVPRIRQLD